MNNAKLLVVIDESSASMRALDYVAKFVAGRQDIPVCLIHTLPSLPPELREISIVNDPEKERLRSAEFKAQRAQSILTADKEMQPVLDLARDFLITAGLPAGSIETAVCYPADGSAAAGEILEAARERNCDTIVLGRDSLSWFSSFLHADPVQALVRSGKGFTIWIVE